MSTAPVAEVSRIETLDVVRGFALLGILLLNILGFALPAHLYLMPVDAASGGIDLFTWAVINISAEGAMRGLFSILFGAGVALFLDPAGGRSGALHFKRTFWLAIFGLFDAVMLLWLGDILFVYALAGFLLYFVRRARASRLLAGAVVLLVLISLQYAAMNFGLGAAKDVAVELAEMPVEAQTEELKLQAEAWEEMLAANNPSVATLDEELTARNQSYSSAFNYGLPLYVESLTFVIPLLLLWDALAMMLLGMALYKYGVLQGDRSRGFYVKLTLLGFAVGLIVNGYETYTSYASGFELLATFPQMQWTYHLGRLGMAMGYLGLLVLAVKTGVMTELRRRLAAVGRMALTNYLSHSFIFMLIFTGAGLGLAGEFSRTQVYGFVIAVWVLQLWFSPWWLARYRYGPVEWLWRALTYGKWVPNRRSIPANEV